MGLTAIPHKNSLATSVLPLLGMPQVLGNKLSPLPREVLPGGEALFGFRPKSKNINPSERQMDLDIYQHVHVAICCAIRLRLEMGLTAVLWKISQAPLTLPLLGMPQAPDNKPSPLLWDSYRQERRSLPEA